MKHRSFPRSALLTSRVFALWMLIAMAAAVLPALPAEQVEAQDFHSHTLTKLDCIPGYDPSTGNPQSAFDNCQTPAPGVNFTLSTQDPNYPGSTQATNGSGQAFWGDLPLGTGFNVTEAIPEGYGDPWVYCEVSGNPNIPGDVQASFFPATGGAMNVGIGDPSLAGYAQSVCYWFNVPPADAQLVPEQEAGTSLRVTKFLCPPGYDSENAQLSDLESACTQRHPGVPFEVIDSLGETRGPQSTNENGETLFEGFPFGDVDLREPPQDGYLTPVAYCKVHPITDANTIIEETDKVTLDPQGDGSYIAHLNAPDGQKIDCYWFNIPEEEGATAFINKYLCAPEFDYETANLSQFGGECSTPHEGVHFEIPANAGGHEGDTDANGRLDLPGIPYGNIELHEQQVPGYITARAYCYATAVPNGQLADDKEVEVIDDTSASGDYVIQFEIPEGQDLYCYIFNVPVEDEFGTVYAYKYNCPPEFDYEEGSRDDLSENCTETPDIRFSLDVVSPPFHEEWLVDTEGRAVFDQVPAGPFLLTEEQQVGYRLVAVFCGVIEENNSTLPTSWAEVDFDGGLEYESQAGQYVHCEFYNAPAEDFGTVHVYKYACPAGVSFEGADREYFETNCTEPVEGVPFGVGSESEEYQEERATDSSGIATWDDVPAGGIGILEGEHEGYVLLKVYCGVIGQNDLSLPESWEEVEYQDGLEYDVPAGQYVHCVFYNAPDPDLGSIVITKYICGPIQVAVDSGGPNYDTFSNQCTDIGVGYSFSLATSAGDIPKESSESGRVTWSGLDPGEVTISETLPTGYDSWAVYCTTDPSGAYEEYAAEQETSFDYTVEAGVTLYCDWFNFAPPTDTYVEVVKYVCPEGYDYAPADYSAMSTNCTQTIAEVRFDVSNESGYTSPKSTNDEGVATWNTVPPSLISIQETPGQGYLPVKVYCSNTPDDETTPPLFQGYDLDAQNYNIEIGATAGYRLVCHWFNAPIRVATVMVYKFSCDLFVTRGEAGYEDYAENCTTPGDGFTFGLYDSNDELVDEQTTGVGGVVSLITADAGTYTLQETPIPDYLTLAVYCTNDLTVPPTTPEETPPSIDLTLGATLHCYWFNVQYEPSPYDPGSIVIHKYDCPPGYPTEPQGGRSPQNHFFLGCQVPASGVNFNAEQGGNTVGSGATDATGTAVITGVAAGTTRISELPREGWGPPKIFCASYPTTGPTILFSYDEQTVDNWGHSYDLVEDEVLECYWFNFPNSQGEEGQPIQIIIHKYLCEQGFTPESGSYDEYTLNCTGAEEGVNFDVSGGDGVTSGGPTDVNGYAEYNGVAPGSLLITETPREGYQTLAVYCTNYVSSPGTPSLFPTEEGQLIYYLADGYTLECYWYNIEAVDYGSVTVIKYACHADYDHESASQDDLLANCAEKLEGVSFNLDGPDPFSQALPTDANGEAVWQDVPAGSYGLSEPGFEGYFPVRVFCTEVPATGPYPYDTGFTGQWVEFAISPLLTPSIDLEVQAGYWWFCEWYNTTLDEYGTIHIVKYQCSQAYDYATRDEYAAACTEAHASVQFDISGQDGYSASGTTDTNGLYEAANAPPGSATMTETPPEGYVPYKVFCGIHQDATTLPTTWEEHLLTTEYSTIAEVTASYFLLCEWYNIPYEEDAPQVWIQKYNCPEEAEWHWGYHQFLAACHEPGANVEFGIGPDENSLSPLVTDASGRIILGDNDEGPLAIQESLPSGYGGFVVFCQFVSLHHTGDYQRADVLNRTIDLQLENGYVVTCVFFNLLEGHEPPATPEAEDEHEPLQPDPPSGGTGGTGGGGTSGGGVPSTGGAGQGTTGGGQALPPVDPDAPATLIITKYTCEPLYDVHRDASDPAVDCPTRTDDIAFTLTNENGTDPVDLQGVTGDDEEGTVAFSELAPGSYLLTEELPAGTRSAFIYTCTSDRRDFLLENPFTPFAYAGPDGRLGVTLEPGETLECAWYDVPEEQAGGQVTIVKYACPGASVIVAQCQPFPDGATIGLFPVGNEDGEIIELVTGEDGTATAAVEGTYTLQELPDTACLVDSDAFDAEGNLVVNDGDEVEVRIYNCGMEMEAEE